MAKKKNSNNLSYQVVFGVLGGLMLFIIVLLFLNQAPPLNKTSTIDDSRIEEHNQNFPWRQGANKFFEGTTLADAKKLINSSFASHSNLVKCNVDETIVPPESFDSRTQWPKCTLPIGNQQSKIVFIIYNNQKLVDLHMHLLLHKQHLKEHVLLLKIKL